MYSVSVTTDGDAVGGADAPRVGLLSGVQRVLKAD